MISMTTMPAIPVTLSRAANRLDLQADLEKVRKLAQLLDAKFEVLGYKVGWDAIIGLVPVVGDIATAIVGAYPIHIANKHGLGRLVQMRMAGNLLIDWAIGEIPVIGDLFDVVYKSNLKNLALLERAVERHTQR